MGKESGSSSMMQAQDNGSEQDMEMMAMLGPMMESMMTTQGSMMNMVQSWSPEITMPEPVTDSFSNIDWAEKQRELNQKVKADYNMTADKKKTRHATILTSPTLDDEDALTTKSLLAG